MCWCCGCHRCCDTTVFSGDHPFECEFCGSCFRDDGTLRGHKRIHTGEKPYECNGCGKRFSLKHQLETHYRVHTGESYETLNISQWSYFLLLFENVWKPVPSFFGTIYLWPVFKDLHHQLEQIHLKLSATDRAGNSENSESQTNAFLTLDILGDFCVS